MAALIRPGRGKSFCGGALITDRHVLTAAHCTYKYDSDEIFVRLGEYDFAVFNETRFRDFRVADIRQHIDFDGTTYENDISIIKLQRATLFNSYIWPVCMPPSGESWETYQGVVTGTIINLNEKCKFYFYSQIRMGNAVFWWTCIRCTYGSCCTDMDAKTMQSCIHSTNNRFGHLRWCNRGWSRLLSGSFEICFEQFILR